MTNKFRIIVASFIWLCILGFGAILWRFIIVPHKEQSQKQVQEQQRKQTLQQTSSNSRYDNQIDFSLDSFSGYAIFRSEEFQDELSHKRIKVNLIDDNADYNARLKSLQSGETQIAVFTIDALIKASEQLNDMPAAIIAFVDETRGADAIVAYKSMFPNIDVLNNQDVQFVLTPDSPSETLARVVISHFGLSNLRSDPFVKTKDANEVYKKYLESKPNSKQVFILWEPFVSKALENPNMQVLVDSSRFRGYIVDVIVCNRDFLVKKESVVKDFIESYLRTVYAFSKKMPNLIAEDAKKAGNPLSEKQIDRLVKGIWWKNTSENFGHMGLNNDANLQHVEDMLRNITNVLQTTGSIKSDPSNGKLNLFYYDKILANLQSENFHPGLESTRKDSDELPEISSEEWTKLITVGTLQVPTLVFPRGSANLTGSSEAILDELVEKLRSWQQFYISVKGNASNIGDSEANKILAIQRAKSAESYLIEKGIGKNRIRALSGETNGSSVTFQLGYVTY